MGYFLKNISDDDIKDIGLIVREGGRVYGTKDSYLIMHDDEEILYDDTYACHYEIIQIFKDDIKHGNHLAGNIYVEIHFENATNSKCFVPVIKSLIDNDKELETFCWRRYCTGLRLKKQYFYRK